MKKGTTLKGELEKIHGAPKQYKQGYTEFYKLKFTLTPDVLIPRPETELLVEEVLKVMTKDQKLKTIIDVGTGSGCIAISIAKNLPKIKIIATDVSPKALEVAKKNAKFHKVDSILFIEDDLISSIKKAPDIIVTNLPYIPSARLMYIDPMVVDFEPKIALDGGKDGFELYRKLFTQISQQKILPKYLVAEIDYTQAEIATQEALRYFPKSSVEIKYDLAQKQRILKVEF